MLIDNAAIRIEGNGGMQATAMRRLLAYSRSPSA
jgi:hypothetical protein